jgi:hypothetical protein
MPTAAGEFKVRVKVEYNHVIFRFLLLSYFGFLGVPPSGSVFFSSAPGFLRVLCSFHHSCCRGNSTLHIMYLYHSSEPIAQASDLSLPSKLLAGLPAVQRYPIMQLAPMSTPVTPAEPRNVSRHSGGLTACGLEEEYRVAGVYHH